MRRRLKPPPPAHDAAYAEKAKWRPHTGSGCPIQLPRSSSRKSPSTSTGMLSTNDWRSAIGSWQLRATLHPHGDSILWQGAPTPAQPPFAAGTDIERSADGNRRSTVAEQHHGLHTVGAVPHRASK